MARPCSVAAAMVSTMAGRKAWGVPACRMNKAAAASDTGSDTNPQAAATGCTCAHTPSASQACAARAISR